MFKSFASSGFENRSSLPQMQASFNTSSAPAVTLPPLNLKSLPSFTAQLGAPGKDQLPAPDLAQKNNQQMANALDVKKQTGAVLEQIKRSGADGGQPTMAGSVAAAVLPLVVPMGPALQVAATALGGAFDYTASRPSGRDKRPERGNKREEKSVFETAATAAPPAGQGAVFGAARDIRAVKAASLMGRRAGIRDNVQDFADPVGSVNLASGSLRDAGPSLAKVRELHESATLALSSRIQPLAGLVKERKEEGVVVTPENITPVLKTGAAMRQSAPGTVVAFA